MVTCDLRVFTQGFGGEVCHYRDKDGKECDALVHLRNGKYGLIEIKLDGERLIEVDVKPLKSMEAMLGTSQK